MNHREFWLKNPKIIYEKYYELYPKKEMSMIEKLNILSRWAFLLLICTIIWNMSVKNEYKWIQISIPITILVTIIIYYYYSRKDNIESVENVGEGVKGYALPYELTENERLLTQKCYYDINNINEVENYAKKNRKKRVRFNIDNYKNYSKKMCLTSTPQNIFKNPLLKDITIDENPPVEMNSDEVPDKPLECYNEKIFMDLSQGYEKENSLRQFYTIPLVNAMDQTEFAKTLYQDNDCNCKTNQDDCIKYTDPRLNHGLYSVYHQ